MLRLATKRERRWVMYAISPSNYSDSNVRQQVIGYIGPRPCRVFQWKCNSQPVGVVFLAVVHYGFMFHINYTVDDRVVSSFITDKHLMTSYFLDCLHHQSCACFISTIQQYTHSLSVGYRVQTAFTYFTVFADFSRSSNFSLY